VVSQVCTNLEAGRLFRNALAVGIAVAIVASAYGNSDDEIVDKCWQKVRAESTLIRYEMKGTSFVAKGALSAEVAGQRVPEKDARAPLEVTWLVDFEKLSMRRTQRFPLFQAGDPPFFLRSVTDVYTPQGRKSLVSAYEYQGNLIEAEFYVNRMGGSVEAWDNPILLAHGYCGTESGGNTFKLLVSPLKSAGLMDLGEITEEGRVLRVFRSNMPELLRQNLENGPPPPPEEYLMFDEYFMDPKIGLRVVRKRSWFRGRVESETSLTYGRTDEGVYYLSQAEIKHFNRRAGQQGLSERVSLKTTSFENDAAGSFDLQPKSGMLIRDEKTMETRRQ
jgi:hypothetical protein